MNTVALMGRLTRDVELRETRGGVAVTSFTLAVDRRFKDKDGERQTDFISCQAWRQTAEFIARYFKKGSRLAVTGSIQTGQYEKDGRTVYTTDVIVEQAYFCEDRRDDGGREPERQTRPKQDCDNVPAPADDTDLPFDL